MAEGIEDAARAFQTEIAPGSQRPRDEGGRFTPAAKPEPLFEERQLEGDPLTGDTRDAGEDKRLAEIERRIADGRSQEGDEDRLRRAVQDNAAKSRNAAADDGHGRAAPKQAGDDDKPEQHDQDGEGHDQGEPGEGEQGDADGNAEQNAEGQSRFKITTLDGEPVERFEVTVDGRPEQVTLDEALSGYIKERTFHQRMSKVAEARQAIEAQAAETAQARDYYLQRLQMLDREYADMTPPEPNWDQEFAANPARARETQKAYATIYGKRQAIAQEAQRVQAEARAEYDRNSQRYAVDQFSQFVQEHHYQDEKALQADLSIMRAYALKEGFSEAEAATVYDKRMLRVLRKAALYDQAMGTKPKPVRPGQGRTLTPGVATPLGNATRRHIDEAQNRLAKSGRLDDAAAVFSRLIR